MTTETAQAERPATSSKYFQPRRIGHVNLWVEEIGQSERFYNSYCGLNVELSEPDLVATFLTFRYVDEFLAVRALGILLLLHSAQSRNRSQPGVLLLVVVLAAAAVAVARRP